MQFFFVNMMVPLT